MPRAWVWLQLFSGWMPVWALYSAVIFTMHQPVTLHAATSAGARATLPAALLGLLVHRLATRVPWPGQFRATFALMHVGAAIAYAATWILATALIEGVLHGHASFLAGRAATPFFLLGLWLYMTVAGVSYAIEATERAGRAEAATVKMQLSALRSQLHPHFLFNALHTVVQLIPTDPALAADAAEQVAMLLRTTVEDDRDLVPLRDEWAFVARYLELERIRFGDRLRLHTAIDDALLDVLVPSFALQTLVENAVRHGAAPRVAPTDITVSAAGTRSSVTLCVQDTGDGASSVHSNGSGTGLSRLRERLAALYDAGAELTVETSAGKGFSATLVIPRAEQHAE